MRHRILPLILSTVTLTVALSPARGAVPSSPAEGTSVDESISKPSQQSEDETRALRQSLFKRPAIGLTDAPSRPTKRTASRAQPPKAILRPLVIAPPPPPREISFAERELSLQPASYTPYDRYTGSVRKVIARLDRRTVTMSQVRALMKEAHSFRYRVSDPYRAALPETTATTRTGDCKAKSLWLYDRIGDPSALYVIGKTFRATAYNHAWVYWRWDGRWWILDPTNRSAPVPADSLPADRYVPYYSFGSDGAFRHRSTWIFMAGTPIVTAPAGKPRVARR